MTLGVSAPISCGRWSAEWVEGKESPCRRHFEVRGTFARDHVELLEGADRKQVIRKCGRYRGGRANSFLRGPNGLRKLICG